MENEIKRHCVILGSAPVHSGELFLELDVKTAYVICADGGLDTAVKYGIKPDLIIGDFDSVCGPLPKDIETITLKVEKDDTDMFAAVKEGINRGFTNFVLLGALGGERFDHSYANLCTLNYLISKGCRAMIADEHTKIFFITNEKLMLRQLQGCQISVFPFGIASCTVSYTGLKYPLAEVPLYIDTPLGVSNRILEDPAEVTVHSGSAIIIVHDL